MQRLNAARFQFKLLCALKLNDILMPIFEDVWTHNIWNCPGANEATMKIWIDATCESAKKRWCNNNKNQNKLCAGCMGYDIFLYSALTLTLCNMMITAITILWIFHTGPCDPLYSIHTYTYLSDGWSPRTIASVIVLWYDTVNIIYPEICSRVCCVLFRRGFVKSSHWSISPMFLGDAH